MARALGAMVDKFRSDMVDYYLNSWFNHKKSNSVVILRDGLVDTSKFKIDSMEVHSDCIILKFSPSAATSVQNSASERASGTGSVVRPKGPSVPVDYSMTDDEDDDDYGPLRVSDRSSSTQF